MVAVSFGSMGNIDALDYHKPIFFLYRQIFLEPFLRNVEVL